LFTLLLGLPFLGLLSKDDPFPDIFW